MEISQEQFQTYDKLKGSTDLFSKLPEDVVKEIDTNYDFWRQIHGRKDDNQI